MAWRVKCNENDTPETLYDKKWKADNVARQHKLRNSDHYVKVQEVETTVSITKEYEI